ncbi:hypothetical protein B1757_13680 [Acidithiobacillus marinus]|uniref:Toprim domain-containing protein n=1 Tax=Acidithiobacillus marinus TaxID=187490 RepID=A0A2I1DIF2_9PROT|nr:AAA domain-containing protein [Acidithiobacillus marinus]PKY09649.1 hypothetical protein B1757_13680 [Acidithiobacillus marinus]
MSHEKKSISPTKTMRYAGNFLATFRLPLPETVTNDPDFAHKYAIVAQYLDAIRKNKGPSDYLTKHIGAAIQRLSRGDAAPPPAEKVHFPEWLEWLKNVPEIAKVLAERKRIAAGAPPLLKFLLNMAELQDMEGLEKSEGKREIALEYLRKNPPPRVPNCTEATLAFALKKGRDRYQVLLSITLRQEETGSFPGHPGPTEHSIMAVNDQHFFNKDGEALGDYDAEKITDTISKVWPQAALSSWEGFMAEIDQRCRSMFGGELHEFPAMIWGNSTPNLTPFIVDQKNIRPGLWVNTYKDVIEGVIPAPAVHTVIKGHPNATSRHGIRIGNAPHRLFLGHMDTRKTQGSPQREAYPLDASQRLAAVTAVAMAGTTNKERVLPVNGPPGTGKTSFLRGVLASFWVQSARDAAAHPFVVYGTGATNKAVSNMIEAFESVQNSDPSPINGRWLQGLPSYGWFHPSEKAAAEHPQYMQLRFSSADQNPLTPRAAAQAFHDTPISEQIAIYQERGRNALGLPPLTPVKRIVDTLHQHIEEQAHALHRTQNYAEEWITRQIPAVWAAARKNAGKPRALDQDRVSRIQEIQRVQQAMENHQRALDLGERFIHAHESLMTPWHTRIPQKIRNWWWKQPLQDLDSLAAEGRKAFARVSAEWPAGISALTYEIERLRASLTTLVSIRAKLIAENKQTIENIQQIKGHREMRRQIWSRLRKMLYFQPAPGERASIRYVVQLSSKDPQQRKTATDILVGRLESYCDLKYRIPLFHLAARYWEGRWLLAQNSDERKTDEQRVHECIMLGVIIVATTHKLPNLAKRATADFLIMDEAGQCAPEVAIGTLALAQKAIMVGDTKQLQPINTLTSADTVRQTALKAGMQSDDLPDAINPVKGSGMTAAQRACGVEDGAGEAGVTLLFHYRCHPQIIEYCNQLLYEGRIIPVRKPTPNPSGIPPMSWVDIHPTDPRKSPTKAGGSWKNMAEIEAMIEWIKEIHPHLTQTYGKPLDQVLAIITPLAAQAEVAQKTVKARLKGVIDAQSLEQLIVGTVHRLQGAERPIVLFSLVQHASLSPSLFADRDGGFMMNVAVSRAKDSFIIFAQRSTLAPTLSDQGIRNADQMDTPIGKLGQYLSEAGTRLYPRSLVVIEAPGKTRAIQKALGSNVAVIATKGYLQTSRPRPDGSLEWDPIEENTKSVLYAMHAHRGLLDDLVIATDDDMAGELIGMQAAELAAAALGTALPVRRMRFHDLTDRQLQIAYQTACRDFDVDMLAAALLREMARHQDEENFKKYYPTEPYISAQQRDALTILGKMCGNDDENTVITVQLEDQDKNAMTGFLVTENSTLARPARFTAEDAMQWLQRTQALSESGKPLSQNGLFHAEQIPGLYPPSTTARILALAADELHIKPWVAQEHLNAMYQQGAQDGE